MPAVSEKQRKLFAIAEHNPGALYKKNKGLKKLSHKTFHEFAATKGLKKSKVKKSLQKLNSQYSK